MASAVRSLRNLMGRQRFALWLSLRMTIAGVAAYMLGQVLELETAIWAMLTATLVMQASLGGSLKATVDRFVGTLGGAAWGIAVALAMPRGDPAWVWGGLIAALALPAVAAAFRPDYRIAPITAAIVLLSPVGSQVELLETAVDKMIEIGLGSVVALVVSVVVFPARAQAMLASRVAGTLELMAELASKLLSGFGGPLPSEFVREHQNRIRQALLRCDAAAKEALQERVHHFSSVPDPLPLARTAWRMRNDLIMIGRTRLVPLTEPVAQRLVSPVALVGEELASFLAASAAALEASKAPPSLDRLAAALEAFNETLAELRRDGELRRLRDESLMQLLGFAFVLDQLHRNLDDLAARVHELAR